MTVSAREEDLKAAAESVVGAAARVEGQLDFGGFRVKDYAGLTY